MLKKVILLGMMVILSSVVGASDLYLVKISSADEAEALTSSGVDVVYRTGIGYLILGNSDQADELIGRGIDCRLVTTDINREKLAIDRRFDEANVSRFDLVYQEDQFRLYRVSPGLSSRDLVEEQLLSIRDNTPQVVWKESAAEYECPLRYPEGMEELGDLILQDSLESYTYALQAYGHRVTGSGTCEVAAEWMQGLLAGFGYPSAYLDTFTVIDGTDTVHCQNVVAVKPGTVRPDLYVVIGGHYDGVSRSPSADDNGSGTAAVLEIARVMADYDTDVTFVFVLFDAEEIGLYGGEHYASQARARGDSILLMFNMDMIGFYRTTTSAKLYHGPDTYYAQMCRYLADSLVDLNAALSGYSTGSDHAPFVQNGYEVVFLSEGYFNSYWHTLRDSTSYIDFPYMTRMVQLAAMTTYAASQSYLPYPCLIVEYPDGPPDFIAPGEEIPVEVDLISLNGGIWIPEATRLYYSINDRPMQSIPMTTAGEGHFQVLLPPVTCDDDLCFYVGAEEQTSGFYYNPRPELPQHLRPVTGETVIFEDDFETDKGWTTTGLWARGDPAGQGGFNGCPDPDLAYSGVNIYGYNLAGDYRPGQPRYRLTSPLLDFTGVKYSSVQFQRWLGVEEYNRDQAEIRVGEPDQSTNETVVWRNSTEVTDCEWNYQEIDISEAADGRTGIALTWTMGPTDGYRLYCGWNIDDVRVVGRVCEAVQVPLYIATLGVPDTEYGQAYSYLLGAVGGEGIHSWTDKNDDLAGTGLTLGEDGLLAGMPTVSGQITFTARVSDEVMATAEKEFSFEVSREFRCGDANGDGSIDVADAVFIINFAFKGGASPEPYLTGDANCDFGVNVGDAVYVINYVFKGGPEVCCP